MRTLLLSFLAVVTAAPLLAQQPSPNPSSTGEVLQEIRGQMLGAPSAGAGLAGARLAGAGLVAGKVTVRLGDLRVLRVAPTQKLEVPLVLDPSNAGGTNAASLTTTVSWDPTRLTLDSVRAGAFGALTANTGNAANGSALLSILSPSGTSAAATVARLFFTASSAAGGSTLLLAPTALGNQAGASILSQSIARQSQVCVAPPGDWGDVNGDGNENIIDAQQVARASVQLSVLRAELVASQGDVNADGNVDILGAQQIARRSVGLDAAVRIGAPAFELPTIASVVVTPTNPTLSVGESRQFTASPRAAGGAAFDGCAAVTWSSSNASAATVDSIGVVTGVIDGDATITAAVGGAEGTSTVTVGAGAGTGLRVNVSSPVPTSRFYILVTGGGLSSTLFQRYNLDGATSGMLGMDVPAGTYQVKVIAADAQSLNPDSLPIAAAGRVYNDVVVTEGARTVIAAELQPITMTGTISATAAAGSALASEINITDPSRLFYQIASFANLYYSFTQPTADRSVSAVQVRGLEFLEGDSYRYVQSVLRPTQTGTVFSQYGNGVSINAGQVIFWLFSPSLQRGQALNTSVITAATSGIRVNITNSVANVDRYVVAVDTGSGPIAWGGMTGTALTSGMVEVPVPAASNYRVRVAAVDDFTFTAFLNATSAFLRAGASATGVSVTADNFTALDLALIPPTQNLSIPATGLIGLATPVNGTMRDPSRLAEGASCALRTSTTGPINGANLGALALNACTFSNRQADGTYAVTGALAAQGAATTVYSQFFASSINLTPAAERIEILQLQTGTTVIGAAATTGVRLNITSPVGASRYHVYVTGGGLSPNLLYKFTTGFARQQTVTFAVPAVTGAMIRVIAADSMAASPDSVVLAAAGSRLTDVNVVQGQLTELSTTLEPIVLTYQIAATGSVGAPLTATVTIDDPSYLIGGNATWGNVYLGTSAPTSDRTGSATQLTNLEILSPTSKRFTGTVVSPLEAGTFHTQGGVGTGVGFGTVYWALAPALERKETAVVTTITTPAGLATLNVNITSPQAANHFFAIVDQGPGTPAVYKKVSATPTTTQMVSVPVAAAGTYRVRVAALDSVLPLGTVRYSARLLASSMLNDVVIGAGATVNVNATLVAVTNALNLPTTAVVNQAIAFSGPARDPGRVQEGETCGARWTDTGLLYGAGGFGTISFCTSSNRQADGTRTIGGSMPARATAGTRSWHVIMSRAYLLPNGVTMESNQFGPNDPIATTIAVAPSTGVRLTITSPEGAPRYYAYITDGGLGAPQLVKLNSNFQRSATMLLPLPAGTGYRIRVVAVDSLAAFPDTDALVAAGFDHSNVTVVQGALTEISSTLEPVVVDAVVPTTGTAGALIPVQVTLTDPSGIQASTAAWAIAYASFAPITTDRGAPSTLIEGLEVLQANRVRRFTGGIAPAVSGTLYTQYGFGVTLEGVTFRMIAPSLQRGEANRQTVVAPSTSTLTVNITSPVAVNQFLVSVDTGFGGVPIIGELRGTAMTTGSVVLPVAAGTNYRIRVAALDSAFNLTSTRMLSLLRAGAVGTGITVLANQNSNTNIVLTLKSTNISVTPTATTGQNLTVSGTMTDPSRFTGENGLCAVRYNDAGQIPDFGLGTLALTCTTSNLQANGTFDVNGSILGRTTVGTRHWLVLKNPAYVLPSGQSVEVDNSVRGSSTFTAP